MATKTITIMEDAYELLKSDKMSDESFTDMIRRTHTKPSIWNFAGVLGNLPKTDIDKMHKIVEEGRKNSGKERWKEIENALSRH